MRKRISILGSTGSIGTQTLDVIASHPGRFQVVALAAGENVELLAEQIKRFSPSLVSVKTAQGAKRLKSLVGPEGPEVFYGEEGVLACAGHPQADVVVNALVGIYGLKPTLTAIHAGKDVALANKETLVAGGCLVQDALRITGKRLLPVDSEHSAIFQCLHREENEPRRIILTASGGPFRGKTKVELKGITVRDALRHPTWQMGKKVTIDSASLMNKGLEVIEAHHLFGMPFDRIDVVIHPQSIVHSLVEFYDGSYLAQLGPQDMRLPIQFALCYPKRPPNPFLRLSLIEAGTLTFERPDTETFPALRLAYEAGIAGGTVPAVLNGANEKAVELFLAGRIMFPEIVELVQAALQDHRPVSRPGLEEILSADVWAKDYVMRLAARR